MAIVKMKRLRLIALAGDRDALLASLLHAGCVEIREPEEYFDDEANASLLHRDAAAGAEAKAELTELQHAMDVLRQYAPQKGGLFTPRAQVKERDLLNEAARRAALEKAGRINEHAKAIGALSARETRTRAEQLSLRPWSACDIPLEEKGTGCVAVLLGTVPNTVDFDAMAGAVSNAAAETDIRLLSQDREQQYLEVLVHKSVQQAALEALRSYGFSFAQLKDLKGTAAENIRALEGELAAIEQERAGQIEAIKALGGSWNEIQLCVDQVSQVLATEDAKERLLTGGAVLYLEGWLAAEAEPELKKTLSGFDCAYELLDPAPEEYPQVPVKLRNNFFTRCMNTITEMYSLPAYDGVDPNPLMAPFFIVIYGLMMADMAYGLLMTAAAAVYLKKARPKNPYFMEMIFWCGISSFIVGALTGGFFGDFIPRLLKIINPASTFAMPALFSPLDDTLAIMVGSVALGLIQIITGMAVSVWYKTKNGEFLDALFDEIAWWIILAGLGVWLGGSMLAVLPPVCGTVGLGMLIAGGLMLVFGGTRKAKGFGKVTSLVGIVYNGVTGFFSDALSYIRIMALMLSGSVIAQVFNTLGATFGNVILFVVISLIGNALNFALNLLGCYVHDLRLQCLEFFGRFYKEGGRPYRPLAVNTKYVDIIKEEN